MLSFELPRAHQLQPTQWAKTRKKEKKQQRRLKRDKLKMAVEREDAREAQQAVEAQRVHLQGAHAQKGHEKLDGHGGNQVQHKTLPVVSLRDQLRVGDELVALLDARHVRGAEADRHVDPEEDVDDVDEHALGDGQLVRRGLQLVPERTLKRHRERVVEQEDQQQPPPVGALLRVGRAVWRQQPLLLLQVAEDVHLRVILLLLCGERRHASAAAAEAGQEAHFGSSRCLGPSVVHKGCA